LKSSHYFCISIFNLELIWLLSWAILESKHIRCDFNWPLSEFFVENSIFMTREHKFFSPKFWPPDLWTMKNGVEQKITNSNPPRTRLDGLDCFCFEVPVRQSNDKISMKMNNYMNHLKEKTISTIKGNMQRLLSNLH